MSVLTTGINDGTAPENMIHVLGGTFTMGSPKSEAERDGDETQHQVTVSGFYMGKYEVTQAEWEAVVGSNPRWFKGANLPVEKISWYDAVEYCNKRSEKEGLRPAYMIDKTRSDPNNKTKYDKARWLVTWDREANGYRLPTEAEWEYACRAGTATPFSVGNNLTTNQANYNGDYPYEGNTKGEYRGETTAAGSFAPNPWGLYDMHGNVWEWCWDWFGSYRSDAQTNPIGAASGTNRVIRGGSWLSSATHVRSAYRLSNSPDDWSRNLGFRVVCSLM